MASQRAMMRQSRDRGAADPRALVIPHRRDEALDVKTGSVSGVQVPAISAGSVAAPHAAARRAFGERRSSTVKRRPKAGGLPAGDPTLTGSTSLASAFLKNLLRPDAIASQTRRPD